MPVVTSVSTSLASSSECYRLLNNTVMATCDLAFRSCLCSANSHHYELPRTVQMIGDTVSVMLAHWPGTLHRLSTINSFKHHLKAVLFAHAYGP